MNERAEFDGKEPIMRLKFGSGETFDANRLNTAAFLYADELMEFDHIEISMDEDKQGNRRMMCFFTDHKQYELMMNHMVTYAYPVFMNLHQVEDYVVEAYADWNARNQPKPEDDAPKPLLLAAPEPGPVSFTPQEMADLEALRAAKEVERTRIAELPGDERSLCLRALSEARAEWLPWHERNKRADGMAMEPRLMAAELLKPIDALLDQLNVINKQGEA